MGAHAWTCCPTSAMPFAAVTAEQFLRRGQRLYEAPCGTPRGTFKIDVVAQDGMWVLAQLDGLCSGTVVREVRKLIAVNLWARSITVRRFGLRLGSRMLPDSEPLFMEPSLRDAKITLTLVSLGAPKIERGQSEKHKHRCAAGSVGCGEEPT